MCQLNMYPHILRLRDKLSLVLIALLSYQCGYYRAFVEANVKAGLIPFLIPCLW